MKTREILAVITAVALAVSPALAFAQDGPRGVSSTGTGGAATVQQAQAESDNLETLLGGGALLIALGIGLGVGFGDNGGDTGVSSTTTSTSTSTSTSPSGAE